MTQSNWEITRARSQYHFDNSKIDPRWDTVQQLGHIEPCWHSELSAAVAASKPVTWRTRGRDSDPLKRAAEEYDQEDHDLEQQGYGRDYVVTNLNYDLAPVFQHIADQFGLEKSMARIHVQHPGQVWNLHLDKLENGCQQTLVKWCVTLCNLQTGSRDISGVMATMPGQAGVLEILAHLTGGMYRMPQPMLVMFPGPHYRSQV